METDDHRRHRIAGIGLAALGLALILGQFGLLYGSSAQQGLMVALGLPGVAVLSAAGAACFACGCLLAAAPGTTLHHVRRVRRAIRRKAGDAS